MLYWWISHPLKPFLPFTVQRGRALWRCDASLAKVATLSWQQPGFGTRCCASAFSAGELLSCGRENLKAKSCAGVWEAPGCQLLGLSCFPYCTNTSSSDLGTPSLSPSWTHITRHPPSSVISLTSPLKNHLSLPFNSFPFMFFLLSPSPSVTPAPTPSLCIDPKPDLNHTLFSVPLPKEHHWSTSLKSKCPCCFLVIGSVRKCVVTMPKKITNLSMAVHIAQWNTGKSCCHTRTSSLGCRHVWTVISRGWKAESDFTTLLLK